MLVTIILMLLVFIVKDVIEKNIAVQFKYVTWQLQAALTNLPHSRFQISDEVQEEV